MRKPSELIAILESPQAATLGLGIAARELLLELATHVSNQALHIEQLERRLDKLPSI